MKFKKNIGLFQKTYNYDYSSVCRGLWCKVASSSKCELGLPAKYTPCGNGKVCCVVAAKIVLLLWLHPDALCWVQP